MIFLGGTSGFHYGQEVLQIHLSVGQVDFLTPFVASPNYTRLQMWDNQLTYSPAAIKLGIEAAESLPAESQTTVAPLAFAEPSAHWDWPCKDNDEEVALH